MNGKALKRWLWDLGHFRNPEYMTTVLEDEIDGLTLTSESVRQAIRSYQSFMREDFDRISLETHGRLGIADGEIGPATMQLLQVERCGCPDFPDGVEPAIGSGSWPAGCTAEYPDNHTFGIHWDLSGMPSFLDDAIEECTERCYAAYRDIGIVFYTSPDRNQCNTRVTWERGRGWIGLAIVGQNQQCNSRIWAKFDTQYKPAKLVDQWSRLLAHQFGHNMGLSHSRGGIMNPSISSGPFTSTAWRGDPSESILKRWFGGQPVPPRNPTPGPGPDPEPPAPDGQIIFRGSVEAFCDGQSLGEFVLSPKPRI